MQSSSSGTCYKISATIVADSFIHIGNGKRTGVIKHSFPFIPGSIIRGSVGNCLQRISDGKSSSEMVSLLFAEEFGKSSDVFFKHCYPLHLKCGNGVFVPSSKTLFKCQNKQCGKLYETFEPPLQCENCGKSVKPFFGFRCINCGELSALPVSMDRISAAAIDRTNYTAAATAEDMLLTTRANQITTAGAATAQLSSDNITSSNTNDDNIRPSSLARKLDKDDVEEEEEKKKHGLLHTIEVIEKGTRFSLNVILASSCHPFIDKITSLITRGLEDEGIGGSKSRGYGNISVRDAKVEEITTELIEKRADSINKASRFSINLVSPMVIDNSKKNLEAITLLEGARRAYSWCFKAGKPSLLELVKLNQTFSYEVFGGWSLKEESQRRPAVCISSGSAFLFKSAAPADPLLGKALASLEYYAIGGYKPHGYGQISVSV